MLPVSLEGESSRYGTPKELVQQRAMPICLRPGDRAAPTTQRSHCMMINLRIFVALAACLVVPGFMASDSLAGPAPASCQVAAALTALDDETSHGGGLNGCGCHFDHKTGLCHCHQPRGCGCACQPAECPLR